MPIVKNDAGLEKVFVDNLEELGDLSARTGISDGNSSVFLHSDNQGRLNVNIRPMDSVNGAGTPTESFTTLNVANDGDNGSGTNRIVKCEANGSIFVSNASFGHLNNISTNTAKISKGKDIITDAGGLQQVLLYGKNGANGNLEPVEMVGDRLLVDCIELSPTGPHTPTSLPSVAIHGQVGTTSGFKNLRVNTDGKLEVVSSSVVASQTKAINQQNSQSISGNSEWSVLTDTTGYGKMSVVINSNATSNFVLSGCSFNGGTFLPFKEIFVNSTDTGASTHNIGFVEVDAPPNFIKIKNTDAGGVVIDVLITLSN